jgi:hypothetical protein
MKKTTFLRKWTESFDDIKAKKILEDYRVRFSNEYNVIFEHCTAYVNKLIKDKKYNALILKTNSVNLALLKNDRIYIFLPEMDPVEFDELYRDTIESSIKLSIRDVSREYLNINNFYLSSKYNSKVLVHSSEEATISTHKISKMRGKEYDNLRNTINKMERIQNIQYSSPHMDNYKEIQGLCENWIKTQGLKYVSDRRETDLEYVRFFLKNIDDERFVSRTVYVNGNLCGLALTEMVRPGFGVYIINKCLNGYDVGGEIYGISGLSKYLYYKTCKELSERGINFLNSGSLGTEKGTREAKMSLQPLETYLESYQIDYGL